MIQCNRAFCSDLNILDNRSLKQKYCTGLGGSLGRVAQMHKGNTQRRSSNPVPRADHSSGIKKSLFFYVKINHLTLSRGEEA